MTEFTKETIAEYKKYLYLKSVIEGTDFSHIQKLTILCLDKIEQLQAENEELKDEVKEGNGLLRSAFMIAKRDGIETNWEAFRGQLSIALERQHKMMYPQEEL